MLLIVSQGMLILTLNSDFNVKKYETYFDIDYLVDAILEALLKFLKMITVWLSF